MTTMTVVKLRPALAEIKSLLGSDKEFLKPLVRTVLQEVLEAEMTDALGAVRGLRVGLVTARAITAARWSHALARSSSEYRKTVRVRLAKPLEGEVRILQTSFDEAVGSSGLVKLERCGQLADGPGGSSLATRSMNTLANSGSYC